MLLQWLELETIIYSCIVVKTIVRRPSLYWMRNPSSSRLVRFASVFRRLAFDNVSFVSLFANFRLRQNHFATLKDAPSPQRMVRALNKQH